MGTINSSNIRKSRKSGKGINRFDLSILPDSGNFLGNFLDGLRVVFGDVFKSSVGDFRAIKGNRNKGGLNNLRLGIHAMREGALFSAIIRFWIASKFSPNSPLPHYYLAKCCYMRQKPDSAVMHINCAIALRSSIKSRINKLISDLRLTHPDEFNDIMKSIRSTCMLRLPAKDGGWFIKKLLKYGQKIIDLWIWCEGVIDLALARYNALYRRVFLKKGVALSAVSTKDVMSKKAVEPKIVPGKKPFGFLKFYDTMKNGEVVAKKIPMKRSIKSHSNGDL